MTIGPEIRAAIRSNQPSAGVRTVAAAWDDDARRGRDSEGAGGGHDDRGDAARADRLTRESRAAERCGGRNRATDGHRSTQIETGTSDRDGPRPVVHQSPSMYNPLRFRKRSPPAVATFMTRLLKGSFGLVLAIGMGVAAGRIARAELPKAESIQAVPLFTVPSYCEGSSSTRRGGATFRGGSRSPVSRSTERTKSGPRPASRTATRSWPTGRTLSATPAGRRPPSLGRRQDVAACTQGVRGQAAPGPE